MIKFLYNIATIFIVYLYTKSNINEIKLTQKDITKTYFVTKAYAQNIEVNNNSQNQSIRSYIEENRDLSYDNNEQNIDYEYNQENNNETIMTNNKYKNDESESDDMSEKKPHGQKMNKAHLALISLNDNEKIEIKAEIGKSIKIGDNIFKIQICWKEDNNSVLADDRAFIEISDLSKKNYKSNLTDNREGVWISKRYGPMNRKNGVIENYIILLLGCLNK